jgi:hypothetical protein
MLTVAASQGINCGYPVWSSEGWKDGHLPVNGIELANQAHINKSLYSYDVFNLLIEHLGDRKVFSNMKKVTLFGFSAGGQTVLRYSMWPQFKEGVNISDSAFIAQNEVVAVQYVVADVSSYVYFDARRPLRNGGGFAVPTDSWLADSTWKVGISNNFSRRYL